MERNLESLKFNVGDKIPLLGTGYLYVMAYKDKYYMARYKGCIPFVCDIHKLKKIAMENGYK